MWAGRLRLRGPEDEVTRPGQARPAGTGRGWRGAGRLGLAARSVLLHNVNLPRLSLIHGGWGIKVGRGDGVVFQLARMRIRVSR